MNREFVKILAYGQYAFTHLQDTIDKDKMQEHVNGALWFFDLLNRKGVINEKTNLLDQLSLDQYERSYDI